MIVFVTYLGNFWRKKTEFVFSFFSTMMSHRDEEEEAAPVPPVPPTESSSTVQDTENDVETSKPSVAKISPFCYEVSLGTLV